MGAAGSSIALVPIYQLHDDVTTHKTALLIPSTARASDLTTTKPAAVTYLLNAWFVLEHQHILEISLTTFLELVYELRATCIETHCE
jgi:hypothetical protein